MMHPCVAKFMPRPAKVITPQGDVRLNTVQTTQGVTGRGTGDPSTRAESAQARCFWYYYLWLQEYKCGRLDDLDSHSASTQNASAFSASANPPASAGCTSSPRTPVAASVIARSVRKNANSRDCHGRLSTRLCQSCGFLPRFNSTPTLRRCRKLEA